MSSYNSAEIRKFLMEFFDDQELTQLCFDYFPAVENEFTVGMAKSQKVQLLLEGCRRQGRMPDLLAALQRERPELYEEHLSEETLLRPAVDARLEKVERNNDQVFLSYAGQDEEFAQRIAKDLLAQGWEVWKAPESIRPGEKWVEAINRGLAQSGVFILVVTPSAVSSRWVESETNVAIGFEHRGQMRLIPLELEAAELPPIWQAYQRIPFGDSYETGLQALLAELKSETAEDGPQGEYVPQSVVKKPDPGGLQDMSPASEKEYEPRSPDARYLVEGAGQRFDLRRIPALAWIVVGVALSLGIWGLTIVLDGSEPLAMPTVAAEPTPAGTRVPTSLPQLSISATQPDGKNEWEVSWSDGGIDTTEYELQESQDAGFDSNTVFNLDGDTTSKAFTHSATSDNEYFYRVRAVAGDTTGPWSDTLPIIGGYRDDFDDNSSGWSIRRTTYPEKTTVNYGIGSEAGSLTLEVRDRWDWTIASPLQRIPAVPYAIEYRSRISDSALSNLSSSGVIFGADWNGEECPDSSDIFESENCFNHFYNANTIFIGEASKMLFEKVDGTVYCPECGGSPIKRTSDSSGGWPVFDSIPNVIPYGWNIWRIEVREDGIDLYVNGEFIGRYDDTSWVDEPYFGLFASTDEYTPSRWLFDYYQVLPLDG